MAGIKTFLYGCIGKVDCIKSLELMKIIYETRNNDGWCCLSFKDFRKHPYKIYPDTMKRILKECVNKNLIEIAIDESTKGKVKGALKHKYRLKMDLNQEKS